MASARPAGVFSSFICYSCRQRSALSRSHHRAFTTTSPSRASAQSPPSQGLNGLSGLGSSLSSGPGPSSARRGPPRRVEDPSTPSRISAALDADPSMLTDAFAQNLASASSRQTPHRLHIFSTKHNTHITFVQPPRAAAETSSSNISSTSARAAEQNKVIDVLLSLSTGNIGFKKSGRGTYDAAYQLMAFVCKQIQEKGMLKDVRALEIVLRGWGAGREATTKALMSSEGRRLRPKITAVVDATRLRQGGARAPKPRRLG